VLVLVGLVVGLARLSDNSLLTHLATGRLILESGHIPRSDPYSFTARGTSWVVQSWLPSALYAQVEKLGHGAGLRLLFAASMACLVAIAWKLAAPATRLLPRLAVVGLFVGIGAGLWAERPYLIGLLALGLTMLVVDGDLDPRWLVPIGWVWVNSHGSFPLGVGYLVVVALGNRLDGASVERPLRALRWLVVGLLAGGINPLGPRLLWFPVQLLAKQDALRYIGEWQAPRFLDTPQRLFLVQLMLCVVLIARKPSYRSALLVAVFGAAALLGVRNAAVASLIFVPVIAGAVPDLGALRATDRPPLARIALVAVLACGVLLTASALREPTFDLAGYPVRTLEYLDAHGVDLATAHLAHPDTVGNFIELRAGADAHVFIDDRVDMYPQRVVDDNVTLLGASRGFASVLERYDIDLVLSGTEDAVGGRISVDPGWKRTFAERGWVLYCRRGALLGGDLGRC
jgi:hypothetical protein